MIIIAIPPAMPVKKPMSAPDNPLSSKGIQPRAVLILFSPGHSRSPRLFLTSLVPVFHGIPSVAISQSAGLVTISGVVQEYPLGLVNLTSSLPIARLRLVPVIQE